MYYGIYIQCSKITALTCGLILLCSPLSTFADGSIYGQIRSNSTGQTVGFASVEIAGCNTIEAKKDGAYIIDCPAGTYTVTIIATGFQPHTSDPFVLNDDDFYKHDVKLIPEGTVQTTDQNYNQQNQGYEQPDNNYYGDAQQQQNYNQQTPDNKPSKSSYSKTGALLGALLGNVAANRADERLKKRNQPSHQGEPNCYYDAYGEYVCDPLPNYGPGPAPGGTPANDECYDQDGYYICDTTGSDQDCVEYDENWNCISTGGIDPNTGSPQSPPSSPVKPDSKPDINSGIFTRPTRPQPGSSTTGDTSPGITGTINQGGATKPSTQTNSGPNALGSQTRPGGTQQTNPMTKQPLKAPAMQQSNQPLAQASRPSGNRVTPKPPATQVYTKQAVTLMTGGPDITLTLKGKGFNRITNIAAVDPKGKINNSLSVKIKNKSDTQATTSLTAASNAVTGKGYYRLLVVMGKEHFIIPPNDISISISKPLPKPTNRMTPGSNTQNYMIRQ